MKTNQEVANEIRDAIEELNKKLAEAKKRGIVVGLFLNNACMGNNATPIQAEIYERINL